MFGVLEALPKPSRPSFKETFPEPDIVNRFAGVAPVIKLISRSNDDLD